VRHRHTTLSAAGNAPMARLPELWHCQAPKPAKAQQLAPAPLTVAVVEEAYGIKVYEFAIDYNGLNNNPSFKGNAIPTAKGTHLGVFACRGPLRLLGSGFVAH
jgi:hypothetical protein